jgi:hypothetical protein
MGKILQTVNLPAKLWKLGGCMLLVIVIVPQKFPQLCSDFRLSSAPKHFELSMRIQYQDQWRLVLGRILARALLYYSHYQHESTDYHRQQDTHHCHFVDHSLLEYCC